MAERTFTTKFIGKNETGKTISEVKSEIEDLSSSGSKLSSIQQKFDDISNSSKPLKSQMRELKGLLATMNLNGLQNTDLFTTIASRAGEIKDAIGDAGDAMKRFSSDTFSLDAMAGGFQVATGAASILTSAMALYGNENKDVQKAILKVQAAMGMLNGVQAIANALNRDSALVIKGQQVWMMAKRAWMAGDAAATTADTVAVGVNSAAVAGSTVVQRAWNVAKAVGEAIMGNFTGLIILGAAALATFAIASSNSTKEQEKANDSAKQGADAIQSYGTSVAKTAADIQQSVQKSTNEEITKINTLNAIIHDNTRSYADRKSAIDKIQSIIPAYHASLSKEGNLMRDNIGVIKDYVSNLIKVAQSQAAMARIVDIQGKMMDNQMHIDSLTRRIQSAEDKYLNKYHRTVDQGAAAGDPNAIRIQKQQSAWNNNISERTSLNKGYTAEIKWLAGMIRPTDIKFNTPNTGTKAKSTPSKTTTTKNDETKPKKGSLKYLEDELERLQDDMAKGIFSDAGKKADIEKTVELRKQIEKQKIELNPEIKLYDSGSVADLEDQKKKLEDQLKNKDLSIPARIELEEKVENIQRQIDYLTKGEVTIKADVEPTMIEKGSIEYKRQSRQNAQEKLNQISSDRKAGIIDEKTAKKQIKVIEDNLQSLGETPIPVELDIDTEKIQDELKDFHKSILENGDFGDIGKNAKKIFDDIQNGASGLQVGADSVYALGEAFSALGQAFDSPELDVAGVIAQAIATMMLSYAKATSEAADTGNPWVWAAFAATGLAETLTIVASMKSAGAFAEGGVIGGSSHYGDSLYANVNTGEMILNGTQQKKLFDQINNGGGGSQMVASDVRIKGSDIYLSLRNYSRVKGKTGKTTGII
jgi:hypothetical protein